MKRIIVTGATSMIGVALIEKAIDAGIDVYAVMRPNTTRKERLPKSDLIHIIYSDLDGLKEIEIPEECDALYHFAWAGANKEQRDNPLLNEKNIQYTFDAVELAYRSGCRKFIGAGSQAEYGPVDGKIDEHTRFSPVLSYGISKYAAGKLSNKLCDIYGMICIWGRIFSVYGKWDNKNTLLEYAVNQFRKGEKAKFSSGKQKWNYLFEEDAGRLFLAMGDKVEESCELIVASDETKLLREFVEILSDKMGCRYLCDFASDDKCNVLGIDPDITKTRQALDINNFVTFNDGIMSVIESNKKGIDL